MGRPGPVVQIIGHGRRIGLDQSGRGDNAQRVVAAHRQHIALPSLFQHASQPAVRAIDRIGENEGAGQVRVERRSNHRAGERRLGRKADLVGHLRLGPARTVLGPRARQIKPAVDQRLPRGPA